LRSCWTRRSWRREHQNQKTTQGIGQLTALIKTRLKQMQYWPGLMTAFSPRPGSTSHHFVTSAIAGL
jgi:hypothetical protein